MGRRFRPPLPPDPTRILRLHIEGAQGLTDRQWAAVGEAATAAAVAALASILKENADAQEPTPRSPATPRPRP